MWSLIDSAITKFEISGERIGLYAIGFTLCSPQDVCNFVNWLGFEHPCFLGVGKQQLTQKVDD